VIQCIRSCFLLAENVAALFVVAIRGDFFSKRVLDAGRVERVNIGFVCLVELRKIAGVADARVFPAIFLLRALGVVGLVE
jgi:hypothetical protein